MLKLQSAIELSGPCKVDSALTGYSRDASRILHRVLGRYSRKQDQDVLRGSLYDDSEKAPHPTSYRPVSYGPAC